MNRRQRAFALEYSLDHNGARAAVRAGYSERRSKQQASVLLARPDVVAEVARLDAELAGRLGLTQESMIGEFLFYHEEAKAGRMPAMAGIRGLEAAAKMSGFMVERSESVSTEVKVWTLTFDRDLEPNAE